MDFGVKVRESMDDGSFWMKVLVCLPFIWGEISTLSLHAGGNYGCTVLVPLPLRTSTTATTRYVYMYSNSTLLVLVVPALVL